MSKAWMVCVVGILSWFWHGRAEANTFQCDNCSEQEVQIIATEGLPLMKSSGPLYVVDLEGGRVRKFVYRNNVTPDFNPEFDPFNEWYTEEPVESYIADGIAQAGVLARAIPDQVIVNSGRDDLPIDAHAALRDNSKDAAVSDYIGQMTVQNRSNEVAAYLDSVFGSSTFNFAGIAKRIELIYQDGSKAIYYFDFRYSVYKREKGTSQDAKGHYIPEDKEDAVNIDYTFPNAGAGDDRMADDFYDMLQRLSGFDYTIIDVAPGITGATYGITCTPTVCTISVIY